MNPIRLLNKRNRNTDTTGWEVIDIDRPSNSILQNYFVMKDKNDDEERERVVFQYKEYFDEQYANNPEFSSYVNDIANAVKAGRQIALRCWCSPKKCHGHVIINKIHEINQMTTNTVNPPVQNEVPLFLQQQYKKDDIDYIECRFVIHMPKRDGKHDWHMVKEVIHLKDGRQVPNVRYLRDYKRKAWVTKEGYRKTHEQKKEHEELRYLNEIETTESDLYYNVACALNQRHLVKRPFDIKESPYVYGLDIPSTVSVKYDYFKRMKGKEHTPFSISYSDTETNMLGLDQGKSKYIIMQSLLHNGKMYLAVLEDFLKTVPNPKKTILEMYEQYMPEQGKGIVKELEIDIVKEPIDIIKGVFKRAHEWKPDFMAFWNLIFDLDKIIDCITDAGYNPEDFFNDPNLPKELRYFYLKRANPNKTSASGRTMTKKPADQWHTAFNPASFYFICQMATYRFVRKSKQLEKGYGLDDILGKELKGLGKLKHKPAEGLNKAEFHIFMQSKYPAEYVIYHLWDVACMPVLNDKIKDLDYSLPGSIEFSDFASFESEPKRYMYNFHYYILEEHNAVTGVSGKSSVQAFDEMTISGKGHIVALEPHLTIDSGINIFADYKGLATNFYSHNADGNEFVF